MQDIFPAFMESSQASERNKTHLYEKIEPNYVLSLVVVARDIKKHSALGSLGKILKEEKER